MRVVLDLAINESNIRALKTLSFVKTMNTLYLLITMPSSRPYFGHLFCACVVKIWETYLE